jgi:hypothetical protein
MGYYINENSNGEEIPAKGKVRFLVTDGAMVIPEPEEWKEGIVCIVDNGPFEAAAYAYSASELEEFKYDDGREKTWLYYPHGKNISGYGS